MWAWMVACAGPQATDSGVDSAPCGPVDEVCNDLDDDCDGQVDEGLDTTWYQDPDGDGYGGGGTREACAQPEGYSAQSGDCDNTDASVSPVGVEVCNDVDDDCDGAVDEDATDGTAYPTDEDGDGYGGPGVQVLCQEPAWGVEATDCDDDDPEVNPGAAEICGDGVDGDCDGDLGQSVVGFRDADGVWWDATAQLKGTWDAPATPRLDAPGELVFCPGTYWVNATVEADVTLRSSTGQAADVELSGALAGSVVRIETVGLDVELESLTLAEGMGTGQAFGEFGYAQTGGGLSCEVVGGTSVTLTDVVVRDSVGDVGGGVASQGCDLYVVDSSFQGNSAQYGAGIVVEADEVVLDGASLTGNEATGSGAGLYAIALIDRSDTRVTLHDTQISDNAAPDAAGVLVDAGAYLTVSDSRVTDNVSDTSGVLVLGDYPSGLVVTDSDFGTVGGGDDSALYDLANQATGFAWMPQDAATFDCDQDGCGVPQDFQVPGTDAFQDDGSSVFFGAVFRADTPATLDAFGVELDTDGACEVDHVLLSAASESATTWDVVWSETRTHTGTGVATSPDIGIPMVAGTAYVLGVGHACGASSVYLSEYAADTPVGFGGAVGRFVVGSGDATSSETLELQHWSGMDLHTQVTVTEL